MGRGLSDVQRQTLVTVYALETHATVAGADAFTADIRAVAARR